MKNIKVSGYHSQKRLAKKDRKREQAEDRQFKYEKLTKEQKFDLIKTRRGKSAKELAKLKNKV